MTEAMGWLPADETSLDEAAVSYAAHGLRVIAVWGVRPDGSCQCGKPGCSAPGKHPIGAQWQKRASSDPDAVRDARRGKPHANIGLVMGGEARLVAVDIDEPKGRASLEEIEKNVRPWPVTLTSASGRKDGGEHRIYSLPPEFDIGRLGNRARSRWPGIDTRTDNGQIVAAPSVHASGNRYRWTVRAPIAEMPAWLFEALATELPKPPAVPTTPTTADRVNVQAYVAKVVENACREIAACSEGGRNSLLSVKAMTVFEYHVGEGLDHMSAWTALAAAGAACGLPAPEVSSVLSKAWRKAQTSPPRRVPPPKPSASSATSAEGYAGWTDSVTSAPTSPGAWESALARTGEGYVKNTFGNVCAILANAFAGRLAFNRMRVLPYFDGRPLRDADVGRIRVEIERRWGISPSRESAVQAIGLVAEERSFHPVQDYLRSLKWDGENRIERVAGEVLGGADSERLAARMLRAWFVSAVARALEPGCKVDTTLVLVGDQGFRKSTFFAVLGGEWFSDSYADVRSKDGVLQVHAAWIYEWAEIERVTTKRDAADVKAFLTIARDDVRPPYGMGVINQPRSSVIVGSTNKAFLDDETGSRRFWPITVPRRVNVELLRKWRDQLWAQAVEVYATGEAWWLSDEDEDRREAAAAEHALDDAWTERVAQWVECVGHPERRLDGVTTAAVLTGAIGLELGRVTRAEEIRAGKVLRQLGWKTTRERRGKDARVRVYRPGLTLSGRGDRTADRPAENGAISTSGPMGQSVQCESVVAGRANERSSPSTLQTDGPDWAIGPGDEPHAFSGLLGGGA